MSRSGNAIPVRVWRLARLAALLVKGLYICKVRFPRLDDHGKDREIRQWSRALLGTLHIRVHTIDEPREWPERCMIVANHISWIDVFAILAVAPGVFVAKSEIRDWPLVGRLVREVGTLFIERDRKSHVRLMNGHISETLATGRRVAICPEGTTTFGDELLRFHAALFQPAVVGEATLLPVAIRYRDRHGAPTRAAAYVGETSLLHCMWSIAGEPAMRVELAFGRPIAATARRRRELAQECEAVVAAALGVKPPYRPPEKARDRPVESL